ncbi:MAG TPA: PQQ-binding-like beta-propeller repeat protein, partial [Phycisphaerae bacterium]|nr:PQQ-binding-like beta-propeller repeat protein [Phycisphaerae bacterium]
ARDGAAIGSQIFHGTWSSPSLATVGTRTLVFFGGGTGVCYAFEALAERAAAAFDKRPGTLKTAWSFHCDPAGRKDKPHDFHNNRREGPSTIVAMPVFHKNRVYVSAGGDPWHGKQQAWLKCIDARGTGDVTRSGPVWSYPLEKHCISAPSVAGGLAYVGDLGGTIHCVDAETGKPHWTHKVRGEIWASTLLADGKVYVGTKRGDFWVLAAGRDKKVLHTARFGAGIAATATAANGVLYVATYGRLWALRKTGN